MKRFVGILIAALWLGPAASAQQVVDRVVARIGDSIITQSQIAELGRFQQLVDGKEQSATQRLHELAEQWIVKRDATLNGFQAPSEQDVERSFADLEKRFGSAAVFDKRLHGAGLTDAEARQLLDREIFLSRYLDYKFRPEVLVDEQDIEEYYQKTLVPELKKAGRAAPPIESIADQVREVLIERGVSERAEHWLDQMQQQWKVDPVESARNPSE
jgi:peptidyl-prolyl cis-trans isomerase SurA